MTLGHRLESVHSTENHATSGAHWSPATRTRTPGAEEHLLRKLTQSHRPQDAGALWEGGKL